MSEVFSSSVLEAINRVATYSSDYVDPSTLKVIVIDGETRNMTIPEGENLFGARGDKNVERKYFQCPKIVGDNIDLSQHLIYVNYVFTDIDNPTNLPETKIGMYHCEDVAVEGDDITFSWLLSGNVLHNPGFIAFKVCAKEKESDPTTVFNTTPAIGIVLYTIPDGSEIIPEEYPDIITQLLADMDATKEEVAAQIAKIDAIKDQIEGAVEGTLINDNTESNIFTYSSQKINTELRKKATYYDSVASMKADSSLKDGSIAVTLGYYSENDGGGATYLIREKQSSDEDDGGSIHELNGGQLVAKLIIEEYVTPEMFGAVNNGLFDASTSINNAITYASNHGIGIVYIPIGVYLIKSKIVMKDGVTIIGAGNTYSVSIMGTNTLKKALGLKTSCFLVDSDFADDKTIEVSSGTKPCAIKNISIIGNGKTNSNKIGGIALLGDRRNKFILDTVSMTNLSGTGIYITSKEAKLDNVCVIDCGSDGIVFDNTEDCAIENILCGYNVRCGIQFIHCYVMVMRKADVFYNGLDGIYAERCRNICIEASQIDRSGRYGLQLKYGEDNVITSTRFAYNSYKNENQYSDIYVNGASNTMCLGDAFYGYNGDNTYSKPLYAIEDSGNGNRNGVLLGCVYRFDYQNGFLSGVVKTNYKIFDMTSQSFHSYIKIQMNSEWVDDGLYLVKTDKQCELTINAHYNGESIISGSDYIIATIPDDAKPKKKTKVPLFRESTGALEGFVSVIKNEIVYHALTTQKYVTEISISYITN